jgi:hypothetical protein
MLVHIHLFFGRVSSRQVEQIAQYSKVIIILVEIISLINQSEHFGKKMEINDLHVRILTVTVIS